MYPIVKHTNRLLRIPVAAALTAAMALLLTLSGHHNKQGQAGSVTTADAAVLPPQAHTHWFQFGRASWYGHALQGMETASGEAYDMNGMTCAHRSLPLGALVRVTNLRNHKSVIVRVNDRGPVPQTRVIDLSYAAAHLLGFSHRGLAPVRIDVVSMKPSVSEIAQLTYPELHGE